MRPLVELPPGATRRLGTARFHHGRAAVCLSFHPDGRRLFTGGNDNRIRVWDLEEWREVAVLPDLREPPQDLICHPDGRTLITHQSFSGLKFWDLGGDEPVVTREWRSNQVSTISLSPDGETLLIGIDRGESGLRWWTLSEKEPGPLIHYLGEGDERVDRGAFTSDGKHFFGYGSHLHVGEVGGSLSAMERSLGHWQHWTSDVAVAPGAGRIAVARPERGVAFIEPERGSMMWSRGIGTIARRIAFCEQGDGLVTAGEDGLSLYRHPSASPDWRLDLHGDLPHALEVSPDGCLGAVALDSGAVHLVETASGKLLPEGSEPYRGPLVDLGEMEGVPEHHVPADAQKERPDLEMLISDEYGHLSTHVEGRTCALERAVCDPTGRYLAALGRDGFLYLWDLMSGEHVLDEEVSNENRHNQPLRGHVIGFSPDGEKVAVVVDRYDVLVLELIRTGPAKDLDSRARLGGRWRAAGHRGAVQDLAFLPGSGELISCGLDGVALVWDLDELPEA